MTLISSFIFIGLFSWLYWVCTDEVPKRHNFFYICLCSFLMAHILQIKTISNELKTLIESQKQSIPAEKSE